MKIETKVIGAMEIILNDTYEKSEGVALIQSILDSLPKIGNDKESIEYHISQIEQERTSYICPRIKYRNQYIISLYGHFKDRPSSEHIMNEIKNALELLEENYIKFFVSTYSILIDDFKKPFLLSSHNRFEERKLYYNNYTGKS